MTQKEKIQQLKKIGYSIDIKDGKLYYGGSLDLKGTGITSLPDGLTVGGYLDLQDCTGITSLPDGLTVGGNLYLEGCTGITSLPDGLTVGGYLDLEGCTGITNNANINRHFNVDMIQRIWGDKKYCKVDGIFTEVIGRKGNIWSVRKIAHTETFYIVTDGNGKYAHGETIQNAKNDLVYKILNRDKSEYENLSQESVLTFGKAIECYRVVTGACAFGTKNFIENILPENEHRAEYTIREISKLTKGQYGHDKFNEFFKIKDTDE